MPQLPGARHSAPAEEGRDGNKEREEGGRERKGERGRREGEERRERKGERRKGRKKGGSMRTNKAPTTLL